MLSVTFKGMTFCSYLALLLVALLIVSGLLAIMVRKHRAEFLYFMSWCVLTLLFGWYITILTLQTKVYSFSDKLRNSEIGYYTWETYNGDYDKALSEYESLGNFKLYQHSPIMLYDINDGDSEWNEIQRVSIEKFEIIAFVQHLKKTK